MKTLKFLAVISAFLFITGSGAKAQITYVKDSLKAGDSTFTFNNNASYPIVSLRLKGTANTDSLKVYHSIDGKVWSIVTLRDANLYGNTEDTVTVNGGANTYKDFQIMVPMPYKLFFVLANKAYLSTRRVDFEIYARKLN